MMKYIFHISFYLLFLLKKKVCVGAVFFFFVEVKVLVSDKQLTRKKNLCK